jgi:quercetin dioxygenase-like cupin family protein
MHTTRLDKIKKIVPDMEGAKGVFKQVPLSREGGVPNFSFRVFTIEPEGHTPCHKHPFEHMNYIIEGQGVLIGEGKEIQLKQGDFALVMPDEIHQFKNTAKSGNLILVCAVPKEFE